MDHLPREYDNPEKAFARYCLNCGKGLSFQKGVNRWGCTCGWVHKDSPQPVANTLIVADPADIQGSHIHPSQTPISHRNSRVLAIQRGIPPFKGKWAHPGGFMGNEAPEEAARREALEEVNLRVRLLRFLGACHPLRGFEGETRYLMNQIVTSWLACVAEQGVLEAKDDAQDAAFHSQASLPELCFSSHTYTTQNWFAGRYGIPGGTLPVDENSPQPSPREGGHCIRCSTPLVWEGGSIHRYQCPDREQCKWIHWDSPTPYARAILVRDGQLLLQSNEDKWTLPNAPIPAYHTPREGIEKPLDHAGIGLQLRQNLAAVKMDASNRIDIAYAGDFSASHLNYPYRTFSARNLPADLLPADLALIEKFLSGHYDRAGSLR